MKICVVIVIVLYSAISYAIFIDWQEQFSYLTGGNNNQFEWYSKYDIGYWDRTIHVDLDIKVDGVFYDNWLYAEKFWSKPGYDINIDWVTTDWDYEVYSSPYVENPHLYDWNSNLNFRFVAHEVGHMFGLYDEYYWGATDPSNPIISSQGIMGSLSGSMLDRYYEPFDIWLAENLGPSTGPSASPIPEPTTIILLSAGMGVVYVFRRQTKRNGKEGTSIRYSY